MNAAIPQIAPLEQSRWQALYQLSLKFMDTIEPHELLPLVLDESLRLMQAGQGSIMLFDPTTQTLRIAASRGLTDEVIGNTRIAIGEGIAGHVAWSGEAKVLGSGYKDVNSNSDTPAAAQRASMCVPLKSRGEIIGVLNLQHQMAEEDFTPADLELATLLVLQAAQAIANARYRTAMAREMERRKGLADVGVAITESLDRDDVLQRVLDQAIMLAGARNGSVMLVSDSGQNLDIVAAHGLSEAVIATAKPRLGEGIAGYVAQKNEAKLLLSGFKDRYSQTERAATPAAMCVPLHAHGRTSGVLNVSDRIDGEDFTDEELDILTALANQAAVHIANVNAHLQQRELFNGLINSVTAALDKRDPYTAGHSRRVTQYALVIARRLEMHADQLDGLRLAGLLHDVGKIGVPEGILTKPGRLTDDEFDTMKRHPIISEEIINTVAQLKDITPAIRHHHERYAGGGYPDGLAGEEIPLAARILAVADTFDAMTSDRPYRKGLDWSIAFEELHRIKSTQLDPELVDLFYLASTTGEVETARDVADRHVAPGPALFPVVL